MNAPEVGQRWKKAREECGLSVRAAAKLIGVHFNTIYDLEKGDDGATLRLMKRAADEYGVSLGFIFGMDDPRPERVPVYLRPLMEPLEPLTRSARESIVRNIASNLRFMSMLYGGAAESLRAGGSTLDSPGTILTDLNNSPAVGDVPGTAVETSGTRNADEPEARHSKQTRQPTSARRRARRP